MKKDKVTSRQGSELVRMANSKGISRSRFQKALGDGTFGGFLDCLVGDDIVSITPSPKFSLLADLGIITVPAGYVHATRLVTANERGVYGEMYANDPNLTDAHFPNPSRVLKPGDRVHVYAYKQIVPGETTSAERLAYLATQKAVYLGAQGASLVLEQKRPLLPKGFWYASFDEKDRLWEDAGGYHRVPCVYACSGGGFSFDLGRFEFVWHGDFAFLGFCDIQSLGA